MKQKCIILLSAKVFVDMTNEEKNYKKLGFKCGIEIHQRLDTHKLFCKCSSAQQNEPTAEIVRRLRPVAGELGDIDPAAQMEFLKNKAFVYRISPGESCLVEEDEEPPHPMNEHALHIGLQVCKMLHCTIPDEMHVMRKTVIDGSNTSGYQRTAIIGMDGWLKTGLGKIGIQSVCIEEEAARIEERCEGKVVYRLNGLGIPLVEIATSADIQSPEHAKEVAESIGMILRSTNVQRGIGTIRQDVNISIREGARIEIKGFQELEKIPSLVENEIVRQISLVEIKKELQKRGVKSISSEAEDVTSLFKDTECNFIKKAVADDANVFGFFLPRFAGLMNKQCGDRTFAKELHAYAQAYGLGIIHSDEQLDKYKLSWEFSQIAEKLKAVKEDLVVIIVGHAENAEKACNAVIERARQCLVGVPEETRVADNTGSKYARPLPGKARMYPETDIPSIRLMQSMIDAIELPKTLDEKQKEFEKHLPKDLADQIIHSRYVSMYENLTKSKIDPVLVASTLVNTLKSLSRDGFDINKLGEDDIKDVLMLVINAEIPKDAVSDALASRTNGDSIEYVKNRYKTVSEDYIRKVVKDVIKKVPGQKESVYMGLIMKQLRGAAGGELVVKILRQEMK
jgi:glutamyl-tRNA(Gln) amidotransferase subunit E